MKSLRFGLAVITLALLASIGHAATATVTSCPTATAGTPWPASSWLPCPAGTANVASSVLAPAPATALIADMRCAAGSCVFSWQLASKILATDAVWNSSSTIWVPASTVGLPPPVVPPPVIVPPPSGSSTVTLNSGNVTLIWTAPTTNTDLSPIGTITGYNVYSGSSLPVALTKPVNSAPLSAGTLAYTMLSLPAGTYYFAVTALAGAQQGLPAQSPMLVIPTITVTIAPVAPTNFGILAMAGSAATLAPSSVSGAPSSTTPSAPVIVSVTYSASQ